MTLLLPLCQGWATDCREKMTQTQISGQPGKRVQTCRNEKGAAGREGLREKLRRLTSASSLLGLSHLGT